MHPRFETFVAQLSALLQSPGMDEARVLHDGGALLAQLVAQDDWLEARYTLAHPDSYQQYLLYRCPQARFSVVSFVWGPGQKTPVHDHTVWGLIGMLRGAELARSFTRDADTGALKESAVQRLNPGDVEAVSPTVGDIHEVRNAFDDRVSISVHVYGADIGKVQRHVFDPVTGAAKGFVSGYANA